MKKKVVVSESEYYIRKKIQRIKQDSVLVITSSVHCVNSNESNERVEYLLEDPKKGFFYSETYDILETINASIEGLNLFNRRDLYYLPKFIEGSTGQRIADLIFWVDYYTEVFDGTDILCIYADGNMDIEKILALEAIANDRLIKCYVDYLHSRKGIEAWINSVPLLRYSANSCLRYLYKKEVLGYSKAAAVDCKDRKADILFVNHKFTLTRHNMWTINTIDAYGDNISTLVCYCGEKENVKEIIDHGIDTVPLEAYAVNADLKTAKLKYDKDSKILKKILNSSEFQFKHCNIDITKQVQFVTEKYYISKDGVYANVLYDQIINRMVDKVTVKLLTGLGELNNPIIRSFLHHLRKKNSNIYYFEDITMTSLWKSEYLANAYRDYISSEPEFVFDVCGSFNLKRMQKEGWCGNVYYVSPLVFSNVTFSKSGPISDTRCKILWAPSYPSIGTYSIVDFLANNRCVIESVHKENVDLMIKYHPNQKDELIQEICKEYPYISDCIVSKSESIAPLLEQSDLVITTPSTVIFDAAFRNKVVIVLADGISEKLMDGICDFFVTFNSSNFSLNRIIKDENYRNHIIKRQNQFLDEILCKSNVVVSDILMEYLQ